LPSPEKARVARLATVDANGRPHVVPICFAIEGDTLYTAVDEKPKRTRHLKRLANIEANPHVEVLIDDYDEDWSRLWWARADGRAAILDAPDDIAGPIRLLAERYPQYRGSPPAGPVICIVVDHWAGWAASDS
jgi:PPOX class probable F420-dependent enzyme